MTDPSGKSNLIPPFSSSSTHPLFTSFPSSVPCNLPTNQSIPTGRHDTTVHSIALGKRIIEDHSPHGILYEALPHDRIWKERQRLNRHNGQRSHYDVDDHHGEGENYPPQITVLESRIRKWNLGDFLHDNSCEECTTITCEGTMYRHSSFPREDAPVIFRDAHDIIVVPSRNNDTNRDIIGDGKNCPIYPEDKQQCTEMLSLEQTVRYLTTLECYVYDETIWMKCKACHDADERFRRWVLERLNHGAAYASSAEITDEITFGSSKRKRECGIEVECCHNDEVSSRDDVLMISNGRWREAKVMKTTCHYDMIVD
ncbi:hypothetical protein ACHAXS_008287 [Conticribra weissflogii]